MSTESDSTPAFRQRLSELASTFARLGLISFGGPVAHIAYFRAEFVQKRRWIDDAAFADLVALCQFLPGPASSQVVFAIGMQRAGIVGAMLASVLFMAPSIVIMIALAYGVQSMGDLQHSGWLHGLKLAAVAVVAQAVWGMGKQLCPDRARISLALGCAATVLMFPGASIQVLAILLGALVGQVIARRVPTATTGDAHQFLEIESPLQDRRARRWGAMSLGLFLMLLVALPMLIGRSSATWLQVFDSFYRSGSLVFGGGHVVLPLLRAEVVPPGWVTDDQFLAGYGAAQAIPGPLFTFSAYLGAVMSPGGWGWLNGLWCVLAIFLPAWLLIGGAYPFWARWRQRAWAQNSLRGAGAAVVGVLLAALYQPMFVESVRHPRDIALVLIGFLLLQFWRFPSWVMVVLFASVGRWAMAG